MRNDAAAILIDSDILIEVSRGRDREVVEQWKNLMESSCTLLCSPVTIAELWQGARPNEHVMLQRLFSVFVCVPVDEGIGRQAGDYLRQFHSSHGLELPDAFIAATAVIRNAPLWTRNRRHYPMKDLGFYRY